MFRSILPFILASLGLPLAAVTLHMPLFEWHISEIVTEFPQTYDVDISPSPWRAYLGDSLEDGSYILPERVRIIKDGSFCGTKDINITVRRSQNDKMLERVLNVNPQFNLWLFAWISIEVSLCGIYMVGFILEYKHGSNIQAIIFMGIAGFVCIFWMLFMRLLGNFPYYFFGIHSDFGVDCYSTITFNAVLLKVYYETLLVFGASILAELGALGIMLRQIRRAVSEGKESSKSAVS